MYALGMVSECAKKRAGVWIGMKSMDVMAGAMESGMLVPVCQLTVPLRQRNEL